MCRRLVAQGGHVIAADENEEALHDLARPSADRIAPLALDIADRDALQRMCRCWSGEPLHLLVMAHALHDNKMLEAVLAAITEVTTSLAPPISVAEGAAVVIFRAAGPGAPPRRRAEAAATAALVRGLADDGNRINALALHDSALARAMADRVCTTALMMALPMARAVRGAVLPVRS